MGLVIAVATIAGYGAAWWVLGLWGAGRGSDAGYALAAVVWALLLAGAWRRMRDESPERRRQRARRGNIIGLVTGILSVLILLTVYVLDLAGRQDLLAPLVAVVMGLHFLALARLFPALVYYATSALLVALGAVGLLLPAGTPRLLGVCLGAACILWLTCVAVLIWPESRRTG